MSYCYKTRLTDEKTLEVSLRPEVIFELVEKLHVHSINLLPK